VSRLVGAALAIALTAGTWVANAPANATTPIDDAPTVSFELTVSKPKRVCAGNDVAITVKILRHVVMPHAPQLANAPITAEMASVAVEATIQDKAVLSTDSAAQFTGLDGSKPPAAVFHFHALKAGISNIDFKAKLAAMAETDPDVWKSVVPDQVKSRTVTVVNCKLELSVYSIGNGLVGLIVAATIEFGDDGHFKNSVFVSWGSSIKVTSPCGSAQLTVQNSTAELSATLDQQGTVAIDLDYQTVPGTVSGSCLGLSGSTPLPSEPSTLHFEVGFRGGSGTVTQTMTGISSGTLPAEYKVVPVEVEGP
jgi:hypothetical protein